MIIVLAILYIGVILGLIYTLGWLFKGILEELKKF